MDLDRELAVATRVVREAGALIQRYVGADVAVSYKPGDGGPVTRADHEANTLIVGALRAAFPDDGMLSEELPDDGRWRTAERVWVIDPLDGTNDFINGREGFAVMIGFLLGERPVLGVVFQPTTGRLWSASAATAAVRVDADGTTTGLRVSEVHDLACVRLVASASHRTESIDRVRARLGVTDELNIGSVGLKLGLIAAGERDLYVNPASRSSIWDCVGPQAILDRAGGTLTDLAGAPLRYRGPDVRNRRGLVASNGLIHDAVIAKLANLFPAGSTED